MPRSSAEGNKRRHVLAEILRAHENVSTAELAVRFAVSEMTIRRDLKKLQEEGIALPFYGGALAAQRITFEFEFDETRRMNMALKKSIALAAASEVKEGQTIFMDTGTTTLELAKVLAQSSLQMTVITASLVIASELWARGNIRLQLLGGQVRGGNPDLAGPLTEIMLERLSADVAFLGSDGIHPTRGSFASDMETARIAERMAACSNEVVVICDSSKIGRAGAVRYLKIDEIDQLITDNNADRSVVSQLANRKVKVRRV